jgi:pyruvate formate lyase activating enzyme
MKNMTAIHPIITNIQRFCVHDGPGIRTTVFLKGCPLRCPWCANPENLNFGTDDGLGYEISTDKLVKACMADEPFYIEGGGVTFSGGEPLMQIEAIKLALTVLKKYGINLCVETSLYCPEDYLKMAIKLFDSFIVDIKILVPEDVTSILGSDAKIFKANIETLMYSGRDVVWRFPLIRGYTDKDTNLEEIKQLARNYIGKVRLAEIFGAHNLAESKYAKLGLPFLKFSEGSSNAFRNLKEILDGLKIPCERIYL